MTTLGVAMALGASGASAVPTPDINQVKARVEGLQHEAEKITEQYNDTRVELKAVHEKLKAARERRAKQQERIDRIKNLLGRLAAEQYRQGELSVLGTFFSDAPEDYLAQAGLTSSFAGRRTVAVRALQQGEKQLAEDVAEVRKQEKALTESTKRLGGLKAEVESLLAKAERELSRLEASQRRRIQQASSGGGSFPVGTTCADVGVQAPNPRAAAAINFACAQLGDSYLWAAEGPDRWDCSGLTMMAWRRGSVSLPHSSRLQATYGTRVSASNLQPGDLVFKYSPISHVGIYIGGGLMVHAPHSGDVVRIASIGSITAAVRL